LILWPDIIVALSSKHRDTWNAVFASPVRPNIAWRKVEAMLVALGADVSEREGSRVAVDLLGVRAVFHRPHPEKEMDRGAVRDLRDYLIDTGVRP
jgi:hypothetical protein